MAYLSWRKVIYSLLLVFLFYPMPSGGNHTLTVFYTYID